ncbi:MAG TPA: alpha/beta hydrolase fold domain-containing protein, partial [Solirubrobacterales bacterium]|nr:alpha/beta hydrolase fold domain-containing protein [Solirubrobacterales bacterium]
MCDFRTAKLIACRCGRAPSLPPAVEHRFLRAACGLPAWAQRRIFGAPPQVDGQTLASDIHALLRIAELARTKSLSEGADVEEARRERRHEARIVANRPPIPMRRVEPVEIPGPAGTIPARLYSPLRSQAEDPAPLLVHYHGGGWVIGDLETADDPARFLAAQAEVDVLSIDYRLAPEHRFPAAVEDAWAAYVWATENAGRLGADRARVAVGGDSAGGN